MLFRREIVLQILLVLIAFVGYWPVIGFEYTLKWDIIDQYFPWRMFIVECLRSGVFPLWNPYEQLGTPIFADPQSGYWYAPVWLSALFGEYTLRSVQVEFFVHVALGGVGIFRLLRSFDVKDGVAFFLALGYVFSGFFIGNAQHLTYVVTGCWLPFVLWSFKNLLSGAGFRHALRFSFFTWLLITGGYPAFSIILFYLLAVLWIFQLWKGRKNSVETGALLRRSTLSVVVLGVLLSGLIFTLWQGRSYFSRTDGLEYAVAAFGPFSPRSMLSFLFPLAAARNPQFFDTDISMSSAYLGWVTLAGFLLFVFGRKSRREWLLLAAVVFFLLASFGNNTPVHRFLFEYLPMLDWFRFPSVFRLFAMTGMLLASGLALSRVARMRKLVVVQSVVALGLLVVFYVNGGVSSFSSFPAKDTQEFLREIPFGQSLALQSGLLFLFLVAGLVVCTRRLQPYRKLMLLGAIGLFELVVFARMNMPVTVVSEYRTSPTQAALDNARVMGFPIPEMRPMALNQDTGPFPAPFWKNLNLFRKQPAWDGYNNFQLKGYIRFIDQEPLRLSQLSRPWVSLADTVLTFSDSIHPVRIEGKNVAYINDVDSDMVPTTISHPDNRVVVTGFEPGRMSMEARVKGDSALLVVMQQEYPGWEVSVDGVPSETYSTDYLFQSLWLTNGDHRVEWKYRNRPVRILTILGWLTGTLVFLILAIPKPRPVSAVQ